MRSGTALAVAVVLSMAGGSAQAEDWCGYAARAKSIIECGYSTAAECESVIGKGGMCFIDPGLCGERQTRRAGDFNAGASGEIRLML